MSEIHVKENESLDSALKRFKRSCAKAGVLAEVRKREHYESPSVKRRKKSEAARKNRRSDLLLKEITAVPDGTGRSFIAGLPLDGEQSFSQQVPHLGKHRKRRRR